MKDAVAGLARATVVLVLFPLGLACLLMHYSGWSFMTDEAVTVLGAQRWLAGEWPYRHWNTHHPWGAHAQSALWFSIFGPGQFGTRSLMIFVALLQAAVIYGLSRPIAASWRWLPCLLWLVLGIQDFPVLSYHWLAVFWFSLAALLAQNWLRAPSPRGAAACGACLAVAGTTLQSEALAGILLLTLLAAGWRPQHWPRAVLGYLLLALILWLPFLSSLNLVWEQNIEQVLRHQDFNRFPYTWSQLSYPWQGACNSSWQGDALGTSYAWMRWFWYALKYGAFPLVLLLAAWRSRRAKNSPVQCLVTALVALTLARAGRLTLDYQSFLLPLWYPLLVWELSQWRWSRAWKLLLTTLLTVYACQTLLLWKRDSRYPIATPVGTYWSGEAWMAEAYSALGFWLTRSIPAEQRVACLPYQACLYTLWQRPNPLRQPVLLPMLAEEQADAFRTLEARSVEWLIFTPVPPAGLEGTYRLDAGLFMRQQLELYQQLSQNYRLVQDYRGMRLLRRIRDKI